MLNNLEIFQYKDVKVYDFLTSGVFLINIIKNKIKNFFSIKFRFDLPRSKNIIQYDELNSDVLKKIIKKDFNTVPRRKLEIYFWIFIKQIFFFDLTFSTYLKNYVKFTSAKIIITLIDNSLIYYTLKDKIDGVYFISIQNGHRFKKSFMFENKNSLPFKNLKCDHIFTFNKYFIKEYKKIIKSDYHVLGCFNNNSVKVNQTQFKNSYLFVGGKDWHKMRIGISHKLLSLLSKYFSDSNKKINILLKNKNFKEQNNEINFYKKFFNNSNCIFHKSNTIAKSYKILDKFENIIFTNSTLGYEAIARKKKIAVFAVNKNKIQRNLFGWPKEDQKKYNFFSAKKLNYTEIKRVLDNVNNCKQKNWEQKYYTYIKELMYFDKNNSQVRKVINSILKNKETR